MSVIEHFKRIVDQFPDATAVSSLSETGWRQLSYSKLSVKAQLIAGELQRVGVKPGDAVVLSSARSPDLVPQLLAVLWVGAHYVFIDPNYPLERKKFIQSECKAKWGLGLSSLADIDLYWVDVDSIKVAPVDLIDQGEKNSPAYIMFTSGSTGTPKGVVVPHRAITRLVTNTDYIDFSPEQHFLLHSNLSFDASTLELWGALLNGGNCVIYPASWPMNPVSLAKVIEEQRVTTLWLTSTFFNYVLSELPEALRPLKQLLIGGEALSPSHVHRACSAMPELQLFNGYGPTENTTFSTIYPINRLYQEQSTELSTSIPIGFPIPGTECEVFNERLSPVADGEQGELLVFGDGLALGYLNREDLTAEKFIQVKRQSGSVERAYRTGDIVKKRIDGAYEYLGRQDKQVKIDGHRIELGEIENRLMALDGIKAASVVIMCGLQQQKRIAAYIVDDNFSSRRYRAALSAELPNFMLPHFFVELEKLPINQNGKLDESQLPDPFVITDESQNSKMKSKDLAADISQCWFDVLGRAVGRNTNFLDAGGTSLEAIKLSSALAAKLAVNLSDTFVFQYASIAAQEAHFSDKKPSSASPNGDKSSTQSEFAVIGIACRFPGAANVDEFWQNLIDSKESISFFSNDELSQEVSLETRSAANYVAAKGIVEDVDKFDADFFGISPLEASLMDPQQRIMLELAWHALEQAGYSLNVDGLSVGVFAGSNWSRYYQQYVLPNQDLLNRFGAFNAGLANESDFLSTRISYKLNLQGPSVNVFTACSTGLVAIAQACAAIEQGQCDMALAGGASIATPINAGYLYQEGGMLSHDGHCRPFDAEASGTTFNDGAGFVLIKRLDLAQRDGDTIHAVVKGYSVNNDGANKASYTAPSVNGQVNVYRQALAKAAVSPSSIGFIETHGTATPLGDPIEVESLNQAYTGGEDFKCAIGSVKSNFGHVIHAAGVASFIKSVLAVREGKIPATLHFKNANPKLNLDQTPFYVNSELETWNATGMRRAAVSSLGVGGTNAHVIIEQYEAPKIQQERECASSGKNEQLYSLLISAKSESALNSQIDQYQQYFADQAGNASVLASAYTSACLKPAFKFRAAFNAVSCGEMTEKLAIKKKKRVAINQRAENASVGFLFTGQGAQRLGMGQWLYQHDDEYKLLLDKGSVILKDEYAYNLLDIMFSDQSSSIDPSSGSLSGIDQTAIAQPALFLMELGITQWLQRKGREADFLIGHSIGEYAAAVVAGVMSFETALRIVAKRGHLMQQQQPGDMVAVKAPLSAFEDIVINDLDLAANNAPELNVVSGPADQMKEFTLLLDARSIAFTKLKTSHAFHSSMMEPMLAEFEKYIERFEFKAPIITIYSTSTGKQLSDQEAMSANYWAQQIRRPVLFSDSLQTAVTDSRQDRVALLEVGPGSTLSSLAKMQNFDKKVLAISALPSSGVDEMAERDLQECLESLWENGVAIDWSRHFTGCDRSMRVDLPLYPFVKNSHWLEPITSQRQTQINAVNPLDQIHQLQQKLVNVSNSTVAAELPQQAQEVAMSSEEHSANVHQKLIVIFEDITGYELDDVDPEAHFGEVGFDSLLLTQVAIALDQQFGGGITFRNLVEDYSCLAALTDFYSDIIPVESKTVAVDANQTESSQASAGALIAAGNLTAMTSGGSGDAVNDLINAQLQIMQLQLQVVSGVVSSPAITAATTNVPNASANSQPVEEKSNAAGDELPVKARSRHSPGTKIAKDSVEVKLSNAQQEWLSTKMMEFQTKFAKSKAYAQENRKLLADPRTVSGFNPGWKEIIFPLVTKASKGSKLWDIDDNELIDITNGFGPILFGHSPDFVTQAVKQQIDLGIETGPQSPLAGEVAALFCELTGNERCSFASTGSEAVIGAIRLARTVTGRKTVVMFEGAYHGIFDEVITRPGKNYQALPAAPGIMREMTSNMLVLPWGDVESIDVIRGLGSSLAAVLVEPVQSRKPEFHDASYIQQLRSVTRELDAALILDEVVTGFRVAAGGIRERFNIDADLATYGKVVGGGYPIGIIGGSSRFMDALDGGYWQFGDDSIPEVGVTFFAGTFVRHPLSLAAAKAILEKIKESGQPLYDDLEQKTSNMAAQGRAFIDELNCKLCFEQFASLFYISVPSSAPWGHIFYTLMMLEGVYVQQFRPSFLTTTHSNQDVQTILAAFKKSVAQMVEHGFIEGDMLAAKKYLDDKKSMPEGAKLGRNERGEPAYFIEDPENKGQFVEVGKP